MLTALILFILIPLIAISGVIGFGGSWGERPLNQIEQVVWDWRPHPLFPWIEYRDIVAKLLQPIYFTQYRWRQKPEPVTVDEIEAVVLKPFSWLDEYGPLWEPGSTAFWLEPATCDELASWCNRFKPYEYGRIVANDTVRIDWAPPQNRYVSQPEHEIWLQYQTLQRSLNSRNFCPDVSSSRWPR